MRIEGIGLGSGTCHNRRTAEEKVDNMKQPAHKTDNKTALKTCGFTPLVSTGKEKDEETCYGYFGARYMDHELRSRGHRGLRQPGPPDAHPPGHGLPRRPRPQRLAPRHLSPPHPSSSTMHQPCPESHRLSSPPSAPPPRNSWCSSP